MTTVKGATAPAEKSSWWIGRSGLVVPLVLASFTTYILVGVLTMEVPPSVATPGPRTFPILVVIAGYVITFFLVLHYIRHPEPAEAATYSEFDDVSDSARGEAEAAAKVKYRFFSDWAALSWAIFGFLAFALLLFPLGWILAAALLFWCVARSMGSTRPLIDIIGGLMMSSIAYLAFDVALGMSLPSGVLGGL